MQICIVGHFLERVFYCEMKWTQESVIEFIQLYIIIIIIIIIIICDPKHPMHFNKIKKQDAWE